MTLLALVAIIFFGFATYNLTCAFVDIPTKKTSRMMMLARKQQGVKAEKLLDVYITKIAGLIAPYLKLDKLKRNKLQRSVLRWRYGSQLITASLILLRSGERSLKARSPGLH